jgi:Ca2+-binding EF-hand superfamily protein
LDLNEFICLLEKKMNLTKEGYQKLFLMMDTDGSGSLSFKELASSLSKKRNKKKKNL